MEVCAMHGVWKLILPVTAAAVLAIPGFAIADCSPSHGATASIPSSQSVAEQPAPTPPAAPSGGNG